jgi:hypothetical protein
MPHVPVPTEPAVKVPLTVELVPAAIVVGFEPLNEVIDPVEPVLLSLRPTTNAFEPPTAELPSKPLTVVV